MNEIVKKLSKGIFEVGWPHLPNFRMNLSFLHFIEQWNLRPPYCLLHYQARPRPVRRFGIYDGTLDEYFGVSWNKLVIKSIPLTIAIDERLANINTMPTAVLLFEKTKVRVEGFGKHRTIHLDIVEPSP